MDLRTLRYFLTIVQEGTMSGAAKAMHVTQPTLSRQLSDLEKELGKTLLIRGGKQVVLTEDGYLFHDCAKEIIEMADWTVKRLASPAAAIEGDVFIGCGESESMRTVIRAAKSFRDAHPAVSYHLTSGNSADLVNRLDKGLFDFTVLQEPASLDKYESVQLPGESRWGVIMRSDHPLSHKTSISPEDLVGIPLICSKQALETGMIEAWANSSFENYDVAGTYNLIFNGTLMVDEGLGCMLCYGDLVNVRGTDLCFRPLVPPLASAAYIVWKKDKYLTKAAAEFLSVLRRETEPKQ